MLYGQLGVSLCDKEKASPGYTLFSPSGEPDTYIINMSGDVVHQWDRGMPAGAYAYLLPNGHLLAANRTEEGQSLGPGGGLIREYDWDGTILWEYTDHHQHHDFCRLSNGNTAYVGLEAMTEDNRARVLGGIPDTEDEGGVIWTDYLKEVTPEGELVWEWHGQDDMVIEDYPICPLCSRKEQLHVNTVAEDKNGNLMISSRHINHIGVIDKKTKKFAWEMSNLSLGHQHDFQELENGNYLVFSNGYHTDRGGPAAGSRIFEIDPETKDNVWEFAGSPPHTFYSGHISGCQRLWTGNTLICEGIGGRLFEVTPDKEVVWNYTSPYFRPKDAKGPGAGGNQVFRCYRYAPESPEIGGRLNSDPYAT